MAPPKLFYRLPPNGAGWYWELVSSEKAIIDGGIANERLHARTDAFKAAADRLRAIPEPYPEGGKWPNFSSI
jgi:hypothetical protein